MDNIKEVSLQIAKRYTYHKRSCSLDSYDGLEGDYCNCNITERRKDLAVDIENLVKNQNHA